MVRDWEQLPVGAGCLGRSLPPVGTGYRPVILKHTSDPVRLRNIKEDCGAEHLREWGEGCGTWSEISGWNTCEGGTGQRPRELIGNTCANGAFVAGVYAVLIFLSKSNFDMEGSSCGTFALEKICLTVQISKVNSQ